MGFAQRLHKDGLHAALTKGRSLGPGQTATGQKVTRSPDGFNVAATVPMAATPRARPSGELSTEAAVAKKTRARP